MSRSNVNAGNSRAGQPGPSSSVDDLAESIQTAVSGAVSNALAPVLQQASSSGRRSSQTAQRSPLDGFASDEEDFAPEPAVKKRYAAIIAKLNNDASAGTSTGRGVGHNRVLIVDEGIMYVKVQHPYWYILHACSGHTIAWQLA